MNKKRGTKKVRSKGASVEKTEVRIAPIPSPEDLRRYEKIQSGFAARLISMAEIEQMSRLEDSKSIIKMEDKKVTVESEKVKAAEVANKRDFRMKNGSLLVSLASIGGFLALSYFSLRLGYPWQALGIVSVPLLGIIGYVTFQKKEKS